MNTELLGRITIAPGECGGRPRVRGMRRRAADGLQSRSAGASYEEMLKDHPALRPEDILAASDCAAHQTGRVVLRGA